MKISVFKKFIHIEENIELSTLLDQIRSGKYKSNITALRELIAEGKSDVYNDKKRSLPAFTPSGLFEGGRKLEFLKEYSGCLVLDLDNLENNQLIEAKSKIKQIPYTFSCFISPSGNGLKILVRVFSRPVFHKQAFEQVRKYYEKQTSLKVDPSGKDITRLCFVSFDEDLFYNSDSSIFQPQVNMIEEDIESIVKQIEAKHIDITEKYENWVKVGFALVDAIGEEGRIYFHRISSLYSGYSSTDCDKQFEKCLKSNRSGITIATFFYLAHDHGVDISKLKSVGESKKKDVVSVSPNPGQPKTEVPQESEKKKKKNKNQVDIIEAYLSSHYKLRFNSVTSKLEISKNPQPKCNPVDKNDVPLSPNPDSLSSSFVQLTDYQENSILRELLKHNLKCSSGLLRSLLYSDYSNIFNPFDDYFLHLPLWDGVTDYIQMMADTVTTTSPELWGTCFKKWIVAAVASVLDDKTVNHTAVIFTGAQGIGKTTWLLNLCPKELQVYLFSGTINPNNKDTLVHLSECMFINMDELENMNRYELGAFKEIITKPSIRVRRAYGHNIESFARRASFMGSVNSGQFLSDSTGSRRFLCFDVQSIDYEHNVDIRQVYAQAYDLFQQGFKFYFEKEEIVAITQSNEEFQINTAEEELLVTYFQKAEPSLLPTFLTASQILNRITEKAHVNFTTSPGAVIRIGRALKKFGFEKHKAHGIFVWAIQEQSH